MLCVELDFFVLTRREDGMTLIRPGMAANHFFASAKQVFYVSGAGDTVIATFAASLAGGLSLSDAMLLANTSAGVFVGKVGTSPIVLQKLLDVMEDEETRETSGKISSLSLILRRAEKWRR